MAMKVVQGGDVGQARPNKTKHEGRVSDFHLLIQGLILLFFILPFVSVTQLDPLFKSGSALKLSENEHKFSHTNIQDNL